MKALMTFAILGLTLNSFGASFHKVSVDSLKSKTLQELAHSAVRIQSQNTETTYDGESHLETRAYVIKKVKSQNEINMVRQYLHVDFSCNGETYVEAEKISRNNMESFQKAFTVRWADEVAPEYSRSVNAFGKEVLNVRKASKKVKVYEAGYYGGGQCEFGRDGVMVIDDATDEMIFMSSSFSA